MGRSIEMTGRKFHRLTVIRANGRVINGTGTQVVWLCKCECGTEVTVRGYCLRKGRTRSCGCYQAEAASRSNTTHGHTQDHRFTPEYRSWANMKERCLNPKNHSYKDYGERGIVIHPEWINSFEAFLAHIGPIPRDGKRYTLDRKENEGNYEPGNVQWSDDITQANNKRNNIKLTAFGKTMTVMDWSRETGIAYRTLRNRLLAKWNHERIVSKKPRYRDNQNTPAIDTLKAKDYWCI